MTKTGCIKFRYCYIYIYNHVYSPWSPAGSSCMTCDPLSVRRQCLLKAKLELLATLKHLYISQQLDVGLRANKESLPWWL